MLQSLFASGLFVILGIVMTAVSALDRPL